jgi:hypothetical protein
VKQRRKFRSNVIFGSLQQISALPNVQYKLAAVDTGYKGWAGGFSEGTYEQLEDYIKTVDKFNIPGNRMIVFSLMGEHELPVLNMSSNICMIAHTFSLILLGASAIMQTLTLTTSERLLFSMDRAWL